MVTISLAKWSHLEFVGGLIVSQDKIYWLDPSKQIPNVAQPTLAHLGLPVLTKLWQHHVKMLLRERKQFTAKLSGNKSV